MEQRRKIFSFSLFALSVSFSLSVRCYVSAHFDNVFRNQWVMRSTIRPSFNGVLIHMNASLFASFSSFCSSSTRFVVSIFSGVATHNEINCLYKGNEVQCTISRLDHDTEAEAEDNRGARRRAAAMTEDAFALFISLVAAFPITISLSSHYPLAPHFSNA